MIITVIGGSASGKSEIAENIALKLKGDVGYFATLKPDGIESQNKIKRHQELRKNKNFQVVEYYQNIENIKIHKYNTILFECITNLVANTLFDEKKSNCYEIIIDRLENLVSHSNNIVFVTGNVFCDTINYSYEVLNYLKQLSLVNIYLSKISDVVIESIVGLPYFLKGKLDYD